MVSLFSCVSLVGFLCITLMILPVISSTIENSTDPNGQTSPAGVYPSLCSHRQHGSSPPGGGSRGGSCTPTRPSTLPPSSGYYHSPPSSPAVVLPPPSPTLTPVAPSVPSPPAIIDPNSPPFTSIYWRNHPGIIWGLLGWWGTVGSVFGVPTLPGLHASDTLQQALSNTRTDGFGALYREGTASFLNSMADSKFPFTTKLVKASFLAALSSNGAATAQARLFKLANENQLHLGPLI
ncbi:hypothetical protein Nepgr_012777 [Nepenthes gracilis]|uniref:Uncharacterized protein n=1 Tax=Nepenthes gracilis TaxID=150966 RepID=A0AAD3XNP0_NEPGR|nr:hypothetical protein Nepgr_012777 [Nepenthes gracilis]